jgi:hypothetical protein
MPNQNKILSSENILTGTVYKIFGLGLPEGQVSRMEPKELAEMPCSSVSTSTDREEHS